MSEISKKIGQRIRNYRNEYGWNQEKLAELSNCHPTYIGQLERGEKNANLESIEKISKALNVPLSTLFEKIDESRSESIPKKCYDFLSSKAISDQRQLYHLLTEIEKYKNQS